MYINGELVAVQNGDLSILQTTLMGNNLEVLQNIGLETFIGLVSLKTNWIVTCIQFELKEEDLTLEFQ